MKKAKDLTLQEAQDFVDNLVHFMYWDDEDKKWQPDQTVGGADLVEFVCAQLDVLRLIPEEEKRPQY